MIGWVGVDLDGVRTRVLGMVNSSTVTSRKTGADDDEYVSRVDGIVHTVLMFLVVTKQHDVGSMT